MAGVGPPPTRHTKPTSPGRLVASRRVSTYERGTSTRREHAVAVALGLLAVTLSAVVTPAAAATAEVTIAGMAFSPETVTVEVTEGEAELPRAHAHVNFVMRDEGVEHTVSFDDRSLAAGSSGRLSAGQTYVLDFEEPGTFLYRCEIHPNMTGTVVVTSPAASARDQGDGDEDGSGTGVALLIVVGALAAATAVAAVLLLLVVGRRRSGEQRKPGTRPTRSGPP